MPLSFYPTDLAAYFEPIGNELQSLAAQWKLHLERYYHDSASWSLCFGHPLGGQAKIDVSAESEETVCVQAVWWIDDYTTFTRSLRWGEKRSAERAPAHVRAAVERCVAEVLAWKPGKWTQVAEGYETYWSQFSSPSFTQWANPWPVPGAFKSDA